MAQQEPRLIQKAFYAQAVADAMGEDFEFDNPTLEHVRAFIKADSAIHLTDDTQMAMFGQEAINFSAGSLSVMPAEIEAAYLRWYATQTGGKSPKTGLGARKDMQVCRAPGNRCMASLRALVAGRLPDASQGRGCGPVMRLLPFAGLYPLVSPEIVQSIARFSCLLTHSHPDALKATARYIDTAIMLMEGQNRLGLGMSGASIEDHGQGWLADECVEMALWSVQNASDYDHLLELSICHGGDSDSVAAVAGSLWGLAGLDGYEKHLARLAERESLDSLFG